MCSPPGSPYFAYAWVGLASAAALIWRHPLADVAAEAGSPLGAAFTLLALAFGSLWGQPTWGIYWAWEARLSSFLLLFFLRRATGAAERVRRTRRRKPPSGFAGYLSSQKTGRRPSARALRHPTEDSKKDSVMLKKLPLLAAATGLVATLALAAPAVAAEHTVKMLNRGEAGLMVFEPAYLQVEPRSEEHTSELQSLMRISYAVFCLKKKKKS